MWQVPKDLEISGEKETFTATLTCDTRDLYGKIEASREIVIEALPKTE
ncbi:MAG: hypothetical protein HQ567_18090 [Candidatus Nealsonbacteria bacterium]|nr:hypothetical protein [Candidatus Nealsonbacteria bacterium]